MRGKLIKRRKPVSGNGFLIAVDFDGVIHSYMSPWAGDATIPDGPVEGAVEWLNTLTSECDVVVFTTRARSRGGRRAVESWLRENGVDTAHIRITALKPPALVLIDDRAWRFEGPGSYPALEEIKSMHPWWEGRPGWPSP